MKRLKSSLYIIISLLCLSSICFGILSFSRVLVYDNMHVLGNIDSIAVDDDVLYCGNIEDSIIQAYSLDGEYKYGVKINSRRGGFRFKAHNKQLVVFTARNNMMFVYQNSVLVESTSVDPSLLVKTIETKETQDIYGNKYIVSLVYPSVEKILPDKSHFYIIRPSFFQWIMTNVTIAWFFIVGGSLVLLYIYLKTTGTAECVKTFGKQGDGMD